MEMMIFSAIMVLALGLLTSISILALSHILLFIPICYFLPKTNFKNWNKSTWALMALSVTLVLSVLFNQDIAVNGYKPIMKTKYFFFGFLSVAPFNYFFSKQENTKKIQYLLYALCITSTMATLFGIGSSLDVISNPLWRNSGFFGMSMNYAHNMSYFLIIIAGLVIYKNESKKYINLNFLYAVFIINLIGFFLTYTRGAWIGLLAGLPFYFFKNNKKWFAAALIGMVLLGGLTYMAAGKSMRRKDSDVTRIGQWQASVEAFKERPILGIGFMNFEPLSSDIKKKYNLLAPEFKGHAHNSFFEILGVSGSIGFLCFISWLLFWSIEMYKREDLIAKIGFAFIITFMAGGLTQSTVALGINLFFIMAAYPLTQVKKGVI